MKPDEVRALYAGLGLPRVALARFLGVSDRTVFRWETAVTAPSGLDLDVLLAVQLVAQKRGAGSVVMLFRMSDRGRALKTLFAYAYP